MHVDRPALSGALALLLGLVCLFLSPERGRAASVSDFIDFSSPGLPGRLYVPPEAAGSEPRPLILFLHGAGETGSNNFAQINGNIDNLLAGAKARGAFLYAPQATTFTWGDVARTTSVMAKIDQAISQFNVDADRLYVTGLSMGGGGTWNMVNQFPDRFAAGLPIAAVNPSGRFDGSTLVGKPTWAFHARNDNVVSPTTTRQTVGKILASAGATPLVLPATNEITTTVQYDNDEVGVHFTEWTRGGHGIWGPVYAMPEVYDWMFSQTLAPVGPIEPAPNGQIIFNNISAFMPIADPSGVAIPAGTGFVAVGSIALPDEKVTATDAGSLGTLASAFTQFGASLPMGVNSLEGLFANNVGAPLADDHPLLGRNIYIVAGDGSDIASSDSLFVFKSDLQFTYESSGFLATIALSGALDDGDILLGAPGTVYGNRLGGFRPGIIAAAVNIPEPAAMMLCGVALASCFGTARRRRISQLTVL